MAHNINVTDVRRMRELDLVWGLLLVLAVFLISTFVAFVLLVSVGWNPFRGGATYEAGIVAALAVAQSPSGACFGGCTNPKYTPMSVNAWLRHLCWELRDFHWGLDYLK